MEPDIDQPPRGDADHLTDWDRPPLDAVPHQLRPEITAYYRAVSGISDCFSSLNAADLSLPAGWSAEGREVPATPRSVDSFVRAHLAMIDTWWLAIDSLDAAVRGPHELPPWAQEFVGGELQSLFEATTALQRAVITHRHGSAGPQLSRAHGFAYVLSGGAVAPF